MNRISLVLGIFFFLIATSAHGQSVARSNLAERETLISGRTTLTETSNDSLLAIRATAALKRLEKDVLVYRSLGDFEGDGRLARVSLETFQNDLQEATAEVEPLLARLTQSKLKMEISNALDSYRDGSFWWQKIYQPRVVHVSALSFSETNRTPSETAFIAAVPYTVAIHWRQAAGYVKRADEIINRSSK